MEIIVGTIITIVVGIIMVIVALYYTIGQDILRRMEIDRRFSEGTSTEGTTQAGAVNPFTLSELIKIKNELTTLDEVLASIEIHPKDYKSLEDYLKKIRRSDDKPKKVVGESALTIFGVKIYINENIPEGKIILTKARPTPPIPPDIIRRGEGETSI